jgi:hypothetical protein
VRVEQGLFAETIARKKQLVVVPDGNREHAVEARQAIGPPLEVGGERYFGVGRRLEAMTFGFERLTQLVPIVNFAVERDHRVALGHRGRDVFLVHDRQPSLADHQRTPARGLHHETALLIGPAMPE